MEEEEPWRMALSTLMGSSETITRAQEEEGHKDAWCDDALYDMLHGAPEKETEGDKKRMEKSILRESPGQDGRRHSGKDVDWLVGNHAAMMHGSQSVLESLSGLETSQVSSRRDGVPDDTKVQARVDHNTFASLKGAVTAYDSVNDHDRDRGDGTLRHPAAVMPSMDGFFTKSRMENTSTKGETSSFDNTGGHGSPMMYDPMHVDNASVGGKASQGGPGSMKYNNKVILKRVFGGFVPSIVNAIQDHSLNISSSSDGMKQVMSPSPSLVGSPSPSQKPPLELDRYLSEHLCDMYYKDGMPKTMYEWQAACLTLHEGILNNQKNLVVSAPTSSGKTLIA